MGAQSPRFRLQHRLNPQCSVTPTRITPLDLPRRRCRFGPRALDRIRESEHRIRPHRVGPVDLPGKRSSDNVQVEIACYHCLHSSALSCTDNHRPARGSESCAARRHLVHVCPTRGDGAARTVLQCRFHDAAMSATLFSCMEYQFHGSPT